MEDLEELKDDLNSDSQKRIFERPADASPERLDKVLSELLPEHSRSRLQTWIDEGQVTVNGDEVKRRHMVGPLDVIRVIVQPGPEDLCNEPEDVAFEVIAEGEEWLVINKPVGLVVHPGAGNWSGTLLNGLLYRYPELKSIPRAGIVHRLDKDTSGLLVVARSETAQTDLVRQLQARTVSRVYRAFLKGDLRRDGTVDRPIGRDSRQPICMSVERPIAPKPAITHYSCLQRGKWDNLAVTLVECRLETGRTHQIRVHMASLGHPLLGDSLYGGPNWAKAERQMLHAFSLSFSEPGSGKALSFECPLPQDFADSMAEIQWLKSEPNA